MVIVTFDGAQVLDVTGPLEVFSTATRLLPAARYDTRVVTTPGGPVRASCGLEFASVPLADVAGPVDTLWSRAAPTWPLPSRTPSCSRTSGGWRPTPAASPRSAPARSSSRPPACSPDGGPPRTGRSAGCWASTYADVKVDRDAIYVRDGNVWTSAGVTAGIDLALAMVADDHGRSAAATVARQLVVYLQRSGGQAQFSAVLAAQAADTDLSATSCAWIRDHLADDLSVPALARQVQPLGAAAHAASSRRRWVPRRRTTSRLSGSSPPAGSSRPRQDHRADRDGPAASARRRR